MKKIETSQGDVFLSSETFLSYLTDAKNLGMTAKETIELRLECCFSVNVTKPIFSFFEDWKDKHQGVAILNYDIYMTDCGWCFDDKKRVRNLQSWLNNVDNSYKTIILLYSDLISQSIPKTKSSILFVLDDDVMGHLSGNVDNSRSFSLIHPTYGEINDYTVDHARKELM